MDHFVWGEVSRELPCGSKKGIETISYQKYISMIIDSYDVERAHNNEFETFGTVFSYSPKEIAYFQFRPETENATSK